MKMQTSFGASLMLEDGSETKEAGKERDRREQEKE